jgi:conjugative transfer pilus assembly protein TraH
VTQLTTSKRLCALAIACLYTSGANAMTMQELFDNINAQGNITDPSLLQAQTMNLYTGGSMFMRVPKRTYNLASFSPPSYNAGCGGIDIYSGGFSYINKEQFVAMLRNIGSNALGYGFKLAIQNLCPTCDNVMQSLESTARVMNRLNIDSCEAAKGVINAAVGDIKYKDQTNMAKMIGVDANFFTDVTDAWSKVANSATETQKQIESAASKDPESKATLPLGNVTWNALKKIGGVTDEYRMLFMSMIGTTIISSDRSIPPLVLPEKQITIQSLIYGNVTSETGQSSGKISLPVWFCQETIDCLVLSEAKSPEMESFRSMIDAKMDLIVSKLATRSPYENPDDIFKFLGATDLPVYKMLAVATSVNNTALAGTLLNRYKDLLAAKYAEAYLLTTVSDIRAALKSYSSTAAPTVAIVLTGLLDQCDRIERDARSTVSTAHSQVTSAYNIGLELAHMERAMNANLSQTLRASLVFGKSMR